jgi:hypothetical protein
MKKNIWDILAWIAFVIVVLYFLLKIFGVIHSPLTIDILTLISAAYFIGRYTKKIDGTLNDIKKIKESIKVINRKCPLFKGSD